MDKKFQVYAVLILLVIIILSLYFSKEFKLEGVYSFQDCVEAGNLVMKSYPRQCRNQGITFVEDISSDLDEYFRNELYEQAIKNNGGRIPIEGFNPRIYKDTFPGFDNSDFNNAQAIGGIWKYENILKWMEEEDRIVTSADGTITNEGLIIVLDNLQRRLRINVKIEKDIDDIISLLNIYKCGADERLADTCIAIYNPVCGWNDPEKIQCIKYPCASTYSNGCEACKNIGVSYWTPSECPQ